MTMKTRKSYIKETHNNAEFEKRIGRVVKKFSDEQESISLEEIESWVARDNMKKREKKKRIMSIAACFIIICGLGITMRFYANADKSIVMAGGDDVTVATESNNGNEETHTTWEAVLEASEEYPEMLVPGYVPEGYEFKELKVEKTSAGNNYEFLYANTRALELSMRQRTNVDATSITDYDIEMQGNIVPVYIKYEDKIISGASMWGKSLVNITSAETEEVVVKIMNGLKSGS